MLTKQSDIERAIRVLLESCDIDCTGLEAREATKELAGLLAMQATGEGEASGAALIAAERKRQENVEGWTPAHDDEHKQGELSMAARSYCSYASNQIRLRFSHADRQLLPYGGWPWAREWWKPSPDVIRNLVKAGALIAAEIDRLLRLAHPSAPESQPASPAEERNREQLNASAAKPVPSPAPYQPADTSEAYFDDPVRPAEDAR